MPTSTTGLIVTVAEAVFEESADAVAVTVTLVLTVIFDGDVYSPVWSMLPVVAGLMLQITVLVAALLTVALNCCACPGPSVALVGLIVTVMPAVADSVIFAVPNVVGSSALVAVTVTVPELVMVVGAR